MKQYIFQVYPRSRNTVSIQADTILEARSEIRKDYPNAVFSEIKIKYGSKNKK